MKWIGYALLMLLISISLAAMTAWGALAIYYSNLPGEGLRKVLALAFVLFGGTLLLWYFFSAHRIRPLLVFFAAFLLLVVWWSTIPPKQDRDWAPEYATLPHATINGDLVTIHNIRNFDYRTETDFTPRYYTKTFDLRQLDSVDVIASYWMGDAIAHIFLSFGFAGKDFLAISIETRRERRQSYSTDRRLFQTVRTLLCYRGRARFNRRADQLSEGSPGRRISVPDQSPRRQCASSVPRLHTKHQLAGGKTRVLQRAHDQLHNQHSDPYSCQSRRSAAVVESPPQRLCASISLRAGRY